MELKSSVFEVLKNKKTFEVPKIGHFKGWYFGDEGN